MCCILKLDRNPGLRNDTVLLRLISSDLYYPLQLFSLVRSLQSRRYKVLLDILQNKTADETVAIPIAAAAI